MYIVYLSTETSDVSYVLIITLNKLDDDTDVSFGPSLVKNLGRNMDKCCSRISPSRGFVG